MDIPGPLNYWIIVPPRSVETLKDMRCRDDGGIRFLPVPFLPRRKRRARLAWATGFDTAERDQSQTSFDGFRVLGSESDLPPEFGDPLLVGRKFWNLNGSK